MGSFDMLNDDDPRFVRHEEKNRRNKMSDEDFNTQGRLIPRAVAKKITSPIDSNELSYVIEEPKYNHSKICHTNPDPTSPPPIKTTIHTMKTYVIEMNEEEAIWLRGVMQNPGFGQSPEQESEKDKQMRAGFFNAVFGAGRPNG